MIACGASILNLLSRFSLIHSDSPDAVRETLVREFGAAGMELPRGTGKFDGQFNFLKLPNVSFGYCSYGAPVQLDYPRDPMLRVQIALTGTSRTVAGGRATLLDERRWGCVTPADRPLRFEFAEDYRQLIVRFSPEAVMNKLTAIVGSRPRGEIEFSGPLDFEQPRARALRSIATFWAGELSEIGDDLPEPVLAEVQNSLIAALLFAQPHNFSHLLDREPGKALPWQVSRVEEHIRANWDQPITIENLALITGASVRAIFKSFKDARGYSPMDFAKKVRLERARGMLLAPEPSTSVTQIARACCFGNLGHFAADYQRAFGERPSETLNRGKGGTKVAVSA